MLIVMFIVCNMDIQFVYNYIVIIKKSVSVLFGGKKVNDQVLCATDQMFQCPGLCGHKNLFL